MPLYEPLRHEALTTEPWNEFKARGALERIVGDVHAGFQVRERHWPIHPLDVSPERAAVLTPLYYGAAGVIWALRHLDEALLGKHRADALALTGAPNYSYQLGETGILMVQRALTPPAHAPFKEIEANLVAAIEANRTHPARGFAWGGAGTMLAALFLFEQSGEDVWRDIYLRTFESLWSQWEIDEATGSYLWMTDLYGAREKRIGALHGFPGIAFCMLRGRALIGEARWRELCARVRQTKFATALREGDHANWLLSVGVDAPGVNALRVQHCVGAPGIVNTLSILPEDAETVSLLRAAGELIWAAGPIAKLPGLCHGIPGSGYALLKLHERTGEEIWLERARRFAMHAIGQADRALNEHGQRKFSLWTGDLGLACYLFDCIRVSAKFPTLDFF